MMTFHYAQLIAVGLGGALGAMGRFWLSNQMYAWLGRDFAWGTLMVNVLGSFAIGLLTILMIEKLQMSVELRSFVVVGFLGAFTTFSTFSLETLMFLQQGAYEKAVINILANVFLCILAAWGGLILGRYFFLN